MLPISNALKRLIRENIIISLCSVFFFLAGYFLVDQSYPNYYYISLIFWSTLLIYQINTKIKFNFLDAHSYKIFKQPIDARIKYNIALVIVVLMHIPFIELSTILFLAHLALISTLYNVPERSKGFIRLPLRSIPILKIFLIAYVWATMSSFLPAIIIGKQLLNSQIILIAFAHFFFIISITLPFDIRDYGADHKQALVTFPQIIGILRTKIFALVCLLVFTLSLLKITGDWYIILLGLITAGLIMNSSPSKKDYYYLLFVDGTIFLYFIVIVLSLE